jgi:hypothetical protein
VAGLQETGTEPQGQGHRRIEREAQQAEAHLAGIQGHQQAISQAALQLPHQRQAAQKQGGRQGFVAGTGAGDLVGAQDPPQRRQQLWILPHQHIRDRPQPQPAPLQIAAPGTPFLAAGHDPIEIVGVDLVVTQVEARLTAKGVGDHLRLAEGWT